MASAASYGNTIRLRLDRRYPQGLFRFLQLAQQQLPSTTLLSATIRLHQYRYPEKTGIPPVARGMLMCYNMGDLNDPQEVNSILNVAKTQPYLNGSSYPLPLDLALPLFRWGVLFREGRMIKLINGLSASDLARAAFAPCEKTELRQRYCVQADTYLQGYFLYQGDEIRLEIASPSDLLTTAQLLQQIPHNTPHYLSFYHLDSAMLADFRYQDVLLCQQAFLK